MKRPRVSLITDTKTRIPRDTLTPKSTVRIGARRIPVTRVNITPTLVYILTQHFSVALVPRATIAVIATGEIRALGLVDTRSGITESVRDRRK